jgi:hypothetical protein
MKISESHFAEGTSSEMQSYVLSLVERAVCFDDIFDEWFLEKGHRIGLGTALNDDYEVIGEAVSLYFDMSDGTKIGHVLLSRREVMEQYPKVESFDSFVKGWSKGHSHLELHDEKHELWMKSLGFSESFALMSVVGPRSAATALMVSFALSSGGVVEVYHINTSDFDDIDYRADLDEEGIDLNDYFHVCAQYSKGPNSSMEVASMFEPVYCRKTA